MTINRSGNQAISKNRIQSLERECLYIPFRRQTQIKTSFGYNNLSWNKIDEIYQNLTTR